MVREISARACTGGVGTFFLVSEYEWCDNVSAFVYKCGNVMMF